MRCRGCRGETCHRLRLCNHHQVMPEDVRRALSAAGFDRRHANDPPGHLYRFHEHGLVRLFTAGGAGLMKVGSGDAATYHLALPGDELVIEEGERHGGVAGPEGWEYVVGHQA